MAFPQIERGRAASINRKEPPLKRQLERAKSIDKLDYDWVESPRRQDKKIHFGQENPAAVKKPYYNHEAEIEMKKRQLKSDASV